MQHSTQRAAHHHTAHTYPIVSAERAIAEGQTYWSIISAARYNENMGRDRRDRSGKVVRKGSQHHAIIGKRIRQLALEVARLTGLDIHKYRRPRPANDNRRPRRERKEAA